MIQWAFLNLGSVKMSNVAKSLGNNLADEPMQADQGQTAVRDSKKSILEILMVVRVVNLIPALSFLSLGLNKVSSPCLLRV